MDPVTRTFLLDCTSCFLPDAIVYPAARWAAHMHSRRNVALHYQWARARFLYVLWATPPEERTTLFLGTLEAGQQAGACLVNWNKLTTSDRLRWYCRAADKGLFSNQLPDSFSSLVSALGCGELQQCTKHTEEQWLEDFKSCAEQQISAWGREGYKYPLYKKRHATAQEVAPKQKVFHKQTIRRPAILHPPTPKEMMPPPPPPQPVEEEPPKPITLEVESDDEEIIHDDDDSE